MRSTSFVAVALCAFASTVYSAPAAQLDLSNIIGSITNPGAGNDNTFEGIANGNGNENGNDNSAGNNNGNNNEAGNDNTAGSGNSITFPSLKGLGLKERRGGLDGVTELLSGITNTVGSITNPTAGSGNAFKDIANGNGNGNGNGNSAGNGNGNGNSAGNGNEAGNGNSLTVSPDTALPAIVLPDINISPTINLARTKRVAQQ